MAYTDFIAAIDLGSSHMVGMVGAKGPAGTLSIIAYEVENSDTCIRRGCVYNIKDAAGKIVRLIRKLENKLGGSRIGKIYVGVGGQSLRSINHAVSKVLGSGTVTEEVLKERDQEILKVLRHFCRAPLRKNDEEEVAEDGHQHRKGDCGNEQGPNDVFSSLKIDHPQSEKSEGRYDEMKFRQRDAIHHEEAENNHDISGEKKARQRRRRGFGFLPLHSTKKVDGGTKHDHRRSELRKDGRGRILAARHVQREIVPERPDEKRDRRDPEFSGFPVSFGNERGQVLQ